MEENKNFSQTWLLVVFSFRMILLTETDFTDWKKENSCICQWNKEWSSISSESLSLSLLVAFTLSFSLLTISSFTPSLGVGYFVVRQKPYFTINKRQSNILPSSPSTCPISEVVLLETSSSDEQSGLDTKQMAILEKVMTNEERVRHKL